MVHMGSLMSIVEYDDHQQTLCLSWAVEIVKIVLGKSVMQLYNYLN